MKVRLCDYCGGEMEDVEPKHIVPAKFTEDVKVSGKDMKVEFTLDIPVSDDFPDICPDCRKAGCRRALYGSLERYKSKRGKKGANGDNNPTDTGSTKTSSAGDQSKDRKEDVS